MKKLFLALVLVLVLTTMMSQAAQAQTSNSTGLRTADAAVRTGIGQLAAVLIVTNGTDAVTLTCYDNTSAAGTVLFKGTVAGASNFGGVTFTTPVQFGTGCFCDVSGTEGAYIAYIK